MSQIESPKRDGRLSSLTNAFKRRQDDKLEISEFHVGDVRAETPVVVAADGLLVGDLLAPEVIVSGLVYGYVACRRLVVAPGGQVWGDVYASSLEMAPSGKVNGWICTLDAGTVDLLRAGELGKGDLPDQGELHLAPEVLERIESSGADIESDQKQSQRRSGIWRQLRSEAAVALIARSEIEMTFDQRLAAAHVDFSTEIAELKEQLQQAQETADADMTAEGTVEDAEVGREQTGVGTLAGSADNEQLQAQLRRATAAAQKYYGELLWARAELRAARGGDQDK